MIEDVWLDTEQAAEELGYSPNTLRNWRTKDMDYGPPHVRRGRKIYYSLKLLREWQLNRYTYHQPRYFI